MAEDESKRPIDELLSLAGNSNYISDPVLTSRYLGLANAKLGIESNELSKLNQELIKKQVASSEKANSLTESLLLSNETASKQNEKNAESMNQATKELARSTSSLNRATWVLVAVTAIQAVIAVLTFLKK
jgi:hypothetical protein